MIVALFFAMTFIQNSNSVSRIFESDFSEKDDEPVTLVFVGDIMGHSPQYKAAYDSKSNTFNYDICFKHIKSYIDSVDIAVANLEVPLAGVPYSGYPNFSSPDALLDGIKNAGFDVILTANNHVFDRRKAGHERTLQVINSRNLKHAGSYLNKNQRDSIYPLMLDVKGVKIALLNYTYGTNGMQIEKPNIVNLLDTNVIKNDIRTAKSKASDLIILTIHWGTEYQTRANNEQRKLARLFTREGVDVIVGGHPHVVQDAETIEIDSTHKSTVFYSLGNCISNQREINTNGGIMLKVTIGAKSKKVLETSYMPVYVHKGVLNAEYQYHLIPTTDFIKYPSQFPINKTDSATLMYFDKETRKRLSDFDVL